MKTSFCGLMMAVLLFVLLPAAFAQEATWERAFGDAYLDYGVGVHQTMDGGYIAVGAWTPPNYNPWIDIWLLKTDASGNQQWSRTYAFSEGHDGPSDFQQTTDLGYIICGTAGFDIVGGMEQAVLLKTDSDGNEQWSRYYGGEYSDSASAVRQTSDGGYIVVGTTESFGTYYNDVWLFKTDASGNLQWNRLFGDPDYFEWGKDVQQTSDGGYIALGYSEMYAALIKTDADGNQQWVKVFPYVTGNSIQLTPDGGYAIAGAYGASALLLKTDSSGNEQWRNTYGGGLAAYGRDLELTSDGGYAIVGFANVDGDSNYQMLLVRTAANGTERSIRLVPGHPDEQYYWDDATDIEQTFDGGYIAVGQKVVDKVGGGEQTDLWLVKFSNDREAQAKEIADFTNDVRSVADPADVITGNSHTFPQVDFTLSGINEPLEFSRIYNSQSAYEGPLGYGWTHGFNIILTRRSYSSSLEIMDGEGMNHFFADPDQNGEYEPSNNDGSVLLETPGAPNTYTWKTKGGKKYHFNTIHKTSCLDLPECTQFEDCYYLTSTEYSDGNQIGFTYTTNVLTGNKVLTQITDSHNRAVNLGYDDADRILTIDEPGRRAAGQLIQFGYADGNLTSVSQPVDADTTYARQYYYDDPNDPHNLTRLQDERGNSFYYVYDANDRCTWSYGDDDGLGAGPYFKTELEYHPEESHTIVRRHYGSQVYADTYSYSGGYVTQVDHVESGVTEKYSYDIVPGATTTLQKIVMNPSENYYLKKIAHYDASFNMIDTVEGLVANESAVPNLTPIRMYHEDILNNPNFLTRILDQRNVNTKLTYANPDGKITKTHKYKEGIPGTEYEVTNMSYYPSGTLHTVTDPNNKLTTFSYDSNDILTDIYPPGVSPMHYSFNAAGRLTQTVQKDDTNGDRYADMARDWLGRITQTTYPQENNERLTVSYDYEAMDLYDPSASYGVNVVDTNGIKTQYLYNSAGLLRKVVKDRGEGKTNAVTTFDYDAFGNLVSLSDGESRTTTFAYDSLDRLTTIEDMLSHVKSFTYYPDGSLKNRTDGENNTTLYNNDDPANDYNRLYQVTYPGPSTVTYSYEPNGLLQTVQSASGSVTFGYDDANRLAWTDGALTGTVDRVAYQYHSGGQRHYMISNLLGTSTHELKNDSNALWKITNPQGRVTEYLYNQYTGNLSRLNRANNTYTTFDFDNMDRLKSYLTHTIADNNYVYDYVSDDFGSTHDTNLIQKITYPVSGTYYEYNYDDLYKLANEYGFSGGVPVYTKNYEYDDADNRTQVSNGTVETYTINNINQVMAVTPATSFGYDDCGNMITKTVSGLSATLQYDYENRLTKITYPDNGTTEFVYDVLGRRLKTIEKNAQGQIIGESRCVYDGLDLIADLNGSDTLVAAYTHGPGIDDPLIVRYAGYDYYYHTNHQGSVTEVLNQNGAIVKTYRYDAYGKIMSETGFTFNRGFTYTGRERHYRSGLYHYRARFYDPSIGRFLTQDPIGPVNETNLYTYVANNPVVYVDPLGLECEYWKKAKNGAVFVRDWIVVPGLSAYGTHLLAKWNPYTVVIIPLVEFGGAMDMLSVEMEYQASRNALMETASRAQAEGLDARTIFGHLAGVELISDAGTEAARLGFSVGASLAFTGAK